jgi:hypothetical protein
VLAFFPQGLMGLMRPLRRVLARTRSPHGPSQPVITTVENRK